MKNTFIEELKKYERKSLDTWLTKDQLGKLAGASNLRALINQVVELKKRLAGYRPLLSDDIVVAFESLLWARVCSSSTRKKAREAPFIIEVCWSLVFAC